VLEELERDVPEALVLRSAKANGFIAGAEIREFRGVRDRAVIEERIRRGLAVLDRLARFPAPTVALMHGFCLGGGLELALACRYRIAREDAELGFPKVRLGLHPGLGSVDRTIRLPLSIIGMAAVGSISRRWRHPGPRPAECRPGRTARCCPRARGRAARGP
jgi:3-hydroxyacyl-CoA dehydrogenase/enoyl-CoA hydratase/3-hydroxybutyryl-CoA epimerase